MRVHPACTSLAWLPTAILALVSFVTRTGNAAMASPILQTTYAHTPLANRISVKSYIAHSSFSIVLPLHLFYLKYTTRQSAASHIQRVIATLRQRLTPPASAPSRTFPTKRLIVLLSCLTVGITMPAVLWYIAVLLASYVLNSSPQ
jgi:hypothetical protein